jgi:FkbM family methyltransferase
MPDTSKATKNITPIKLPPQDRHFTKFAARGYYQRAELVSILPLIPRFRLAVDIGGHVGFWARDLAEKFAHVVSFEPEPGNFECLIANVPENVEAHRCALGADVGAARLENPAPENSGAWEVRDGNDVMVLPLDHFGLRPDFIKIDVQGYERPVIRGARQTIARHHPVMLIEGDPSRYAGILEELGALLFGRMGKEVVWIWPELLPETIPDKMTGHVDDW